MHNVCNNLLDDGKQRLWHRQNKKTISAVYHTGNITIFIFEMVAETTFDWMHATHASSAFTIHTLIQLTSGAFHIACVHVCMSWNDRRTTGKTKSWNHQINLFKSLLNRIFMAHFGLKWFLFCCKRNSFLCFCYCEIQLYCVYFIVTIFFIYSYHS